MWQSHGLHEKYHETILETSFLDIGLKLSSVLWISFNFPLGVIAVLKKDKNFMKYPQIKLSAYSLLQKSGLDHDLITSFHLKLYV